jgi:hypothetical protein
LPLSRPSLVPPRPSLVPPSSHPFLFVLPPPASPLQLS